MGKNPKKTTDTKKNPLDSSKSRGLIKEVTGITSFSEGVSYGYL
jgi:hypothetical protein